MNHYGQLAMNHSRRHRPTAYASIDGPAGFFTRAGEEIQDLVTIRHDEILGSLRPGENLEDYRLRSYQARSMAEELTLADHHLFQAEDDPDEETETDPAMERYWRELDRINQEFRNPV
ncbi:MAG: hypothetical protein JJE52_14795 [Acidimicrobiia bacterium]|nr:hypothetical protein [Acidimicrobiia bacterium]